MQNELFHSASKKGGQERTAGCLPACWEGLLCAWHGHGLRWPGWRSPTSPRRLKAPGPPCGICCRGAGHRESGAGTGPPFTGPVYRAVAIPGTALPTKPILHRRWQGHPSLCLKDLHLPYSARLSWSTGRGGGGRRVGTLLKIQKVIHCAHISCTIWFTAGYL